jgi:hypothetical protein
MFITLTATNGDEYRLSWWQVRALITSKETQVTTVHARIDDRPVAFDVAKPGAEIEALVSASKDEMAN